LNRPDDTALSIGLVLKGKVMQPSEETVKKNIIDQLKWDNRVDISNLKVEVSGGNVKLTGTVPSYRMYEIVNMDVLDVHGVTYLTNELKVKYRSTGTLPGDEQIKKNIEKMLSWDPDIDPVNISVAVNAGIVSLEGYVSAIWKKVMVEDMISNLTGVMQIINKLAIVPTDSFFDQAISEEIIAAFNRNIRIDAQDVNIRVENQIVILSGKVPSWKAYHAARDIVLYTRGVKEVQNNLMVI
jgi:osmotically-inducible protein OsmY